MTYLVDTSLLVRLANKSDAFYSVAVNALAELHRRQEVVFLTPQNLIEFRSCATRPTAVNGLGMTLTVAEQKAVLFESSFPLLPDTAAIFPAWKLIVQSAAVAGKQVHDARLVAVCHAHRITHLLTFNTGHFVRLAAIPPGVVVVDPATV